MKVHQLLYYSTLGSRVIKRRRRHPYLGIVVEVGVRRRVHPVFPQPPNRGTSLIRNSAPLGPYGRNMPKALWWSWGDWMFLMSEAPLYTQGLATPLPSEEGTVFVLKDFNLKDQAKIWP